MTRNTPLVVPTLVSILIRKSLATSASSARGQQPAYTMLHFPVGCPGNRWPAARFVAQPRRQTTGPGKPTRKRRGEEVGSIAPLAITRRRQPVIAMPLPHAHPWSTRAATRSSSPAPTGAPQGELQTFPRAFSYHITKRSSHRWHTHKHLECRVTDSLTYSQARGVPRKRCARPVHRTGAPRRCRSGGRLGLGPIRAAAGQRSGPCGGDAGVRRRGRGDAQSGSDAQEP